MRRLTCALTAVAALTACQPAEPPFSSCTEASAAHATPLHADHPRWNPRLDHDHDGTACE